jgi:hypothetical protein
LPAERKIPALRHANPPQNGAFQGFVNHLAALSKQAFNEFRARVVTACVYALVKKFVASNA